MPPPDVLRTYNEIVPNAAERIFVLMEMQAVHRTEMERKGFWRSYSGLIAGFIVAMTPLGLGAWLIFDGHDWAGGIVVGVDLVGLAYVFVFGSRNFRRPPSSNSPP